MARAVRWNRLSYERKVPKVERMTVSSAGIAQVLYKEESETLEIEFSSGGVYQFFNVPSAVFDQLMGSPSKDEYYSSNIGKRFPYLRVR
jgi:CO/xanthine dehydrogenase FAD-binding subunit